MTAGGALAAPSEDRILPVDQYTSQKARTLAQKYAPALRALNAGIYHCLPWLDVPKHSIGFFRPKHLAQPQDQRYLSLRIYIEQEASPQFAALADKDPGGGVQLPQTLQDPQLPARAGGSLPLTQRRRSRRSPGNAISRYGIARRRNHRASLTSSPGLRRPGPGVTRYTSVSNGNPFGP